MTDSRDDAHCICPPRDSSVSSIWSDDLELVD